MQGLKEIQLTKANKSSTDANSPGIMAVFLDADHTQLTLHTYGNPKQYYWERPWSKNIRAFSQQKEFLDNIRQYAMIGCITFNINRKRIRGTYKALGFSRKDYYLHTEFIDPRKFPTIGKNKHIAECLLQHYKKENAPTIVQIIVMDDDPENIRKLKYFHWFVSTHEPYCHEPRLQMVKIIDKLVAKPEEVVKVIKTEKGLARVPIMVFDETLQMEATQEKYYTRNAFVQVMEEVEKECIAFAKSPTFPATIDSKKITQRKIERLRLTSSFDPSCVRTKEPQDEDDTAFLISSL